VLAGHVKQADLEEQVAHAIEQAEQDDAAFPERLNSPEGQGMQFPLLR
jgi:hypothetical protein